MNYPIDAVIAITYRCNARCTICDIWKKTEGKNFEPNFCLKLPKTLRYINISGGEPFLNQQIVEIVRTIRQHCPKAKIIISSNGLATDLILAKFKEIQVIDKNVGLVISLDGLDQTNDLVRGVPNAYKKALGTIVQVKKTGLKNLKIAFTLAPENLQELPKVYRLAKKLRVGFTLSSTQSSDFYFGQKNLKIDDADALKEIFSPIISDLLQIKNLKQWPRAYYIWGLYKFLANGQPPLPYKAGLSHFFLDPSGTVYPSVVDNYPLGNLTKNNFSEILAGPKNKNFQTNNQKNKNSVWMICVARTAMKKHPIRVLLQIITLQVRRFMRKGLLQ